MSIFDDVVEVTEVPVTRYVARFAIAYLLLMAAYAIAVSVLPVELPSSMGAVLLMCAALFAAERFAKENRRRPQPGERLKFALGGTGIALSAQFILMVLVIAAARMGADGTVGAAEKAFSEMGAVALAAIFAGFGLLYFGVCYFFFRWGASWSLKADAKKG